jgi:ketosteroid isomerase-like protein
MKKTILWIGLLVIACRACAAQPTVSPNPAAVASTRQLVQAYIAAQEAKDTDRYLATFAPEAHIYDMTLTNPDVGLVKNLESFVRVDFDPKSSFAVKYDDYFISPDGHFAALRGKYTNLGKDGQPVSVHLVVLLEMKDGKVLKETEYYDGSSFP